MVFHSPADFLIAPDGRVVAGKYGEHADDQWSVDELTDLGVPFVTVRSAWRTRIRRVGYVRAGWTRRRRQRSLGD